MATRAEGLHPEDEALIEELRVLREERDAAEAEAELRRRGAEAISDAARELERPEPKPKAGEILIDLFDKNSLEQIRNQEVEKEYGTGNIAWLRRLINGADIVSFDKRGEVQYHFWREAGRRTLRTLFNRRTLAGAGMLAVIGFCTGGAGMIAKGGFAGGVIGRIAAEVNAQFTGEEARARIALLVAQGERWQAMKKFARDAKAAINPDQRYRATSGLVDEHLEASESALRHDVGQEEEHLAQVLARQDTERNMLELFGVGAGMAAGFVAAKATIAAGAAAGGHAAVEAGKEAFGKVDTDLSAVRELFGGVNEPNLVENLHYVHQDAGQWQFLLTPQEAMNTADAIQNAGPMSVDAYNNSVALESAAEAGLNTSRPWESAAEAWKIYGYAGAKALGVLGATTLAGMTGGDGSERPSSGDVKDRKTANAREHRRVMESVERPKEFIETKGGETLEVQGLGDTLPTLMGKPWNPDWRYARIAQVAPHPTSPRALEAHVAFYRTESEMRGTSGTPAETFVIPLADWEKLRDASKAAYPDRPLSAAQKEELKNPRLAEYYTDATGKSVKFVEKPGADKLKIVVDRNGVAQPSALEVKGSYTVERVDLDKGLVELRDARGGGMVWVNADGLRQVASLEAKAAAAGAETGKPTKELAELRKQLKARDENEPYQGSVWIVPEHTVLDGTDEDGEQIDIEAGSYVVTGIDRAKGQYTLKSLTDGKQPPVRVSLAELVSKNVGSEETRVGQIFREKSARGEDVPDDNEIRERLRFNYKHETDAAPVLYEVTRLSAGGGKKGGELGKVEITEVNAAGVRSKVKKWTDRLSLARDGVYVR